MIKLECNNINKFHRSEIPFLNNVGLTGVDDYTDMNFLESIYNEYPFVEFGVCFDDPDNSSLEYAGYRLKNKMALFPHLPWVAHLSEKNVKFLIRCFNVNYLKDILWKRIQINIDLIDFITKNDTSFLFNLIFNLCTDIHYDGQIILPENASTRHIYNSVKIPPFIDILSDVSGGKGICPTQYNNWPNPYHNQFGYAGGININNIQNVLYYLRTIVSHANFIWIDLESSLKNSYNQQFDASKAQLIAQIAQPFVKNPNPLQKWHHQPS